MRHKMKCKTHVKSLLKFVLVFVCLFVFCCINCNKYMRIHKDKKTTTRANGLHMVIPENYFDHIPSSYLPNIHSNKPINHFCRNCVFVQFLSLIGDFIREPISAYILP